MSFMESTRALARVRRPSARRKRLESLSMIATKIKIFSKYRRRPRRSRPLKLFKPRWYTNDDCSLKIIQTEIYRNDDAVRGVCVFARLAGSHTLHLPWSGNRKIQKSFNHSNSHRTLKLKNDAYLGSRPWSTRPKNYVPVWYFFLHLSGGDFI